MSDSDSGKGSPIIEYRSRTYFRHPKILDNDRNTKLHYLASKGDDESILQHIGNESPMIDPENYMNWTPLMMACRKGYASTVKILLDHRANATKINKYGMNVFHLAVVSGNLELVKLILDHLLIGGISRRHLEKQFSALSLAILFHHEEILEYLFSNHFQIDLATKVTGITPLMFAQAIDNSAAISFLLQNKADIKMKNFLGHTAVDIAVIRQQIKFINPEQKTATAEQPAQKQQEQTEKQNQNLKDMLQGKNVRQVPPPPLPAPPTILPPNLTPNQMPFIVVTPTELFNTPVAYMAPPNVPFNARKSSNISPMDMPPPPPVTPITPLTLTFPRQVFFPPEFSPCQVAYNMVDCYNSDLLNARINSSPGMFFSPPMLNVLSPRMQ
ncbi:ankyrin repeat domain-containing protein 16-like [Rhynchophorus ferrugineus]|uniref:ankyrin repeat domain-containing protein 16-like n=1 Tax=Rhynchophorus ferrugineus TaxID=354439 RepID=UPI003FCD5EC8